MKKLFIYILLFISWVWVVFAAANYIRTWKNSDTINYYWPENDIFTLNWRLDLEDSRSSSYSWGYRWKITWTIDSDLFGLFDIDNKLDLKLASKNPDNSKCWNQESLELYKITWKIKSLFWWEMQIDQNDSYFCSNEYIYLKLKSPSLWEKEIWNWTAQNNLVDNFWKQEIAVSGILNITWKTDSNIENRWDGKFNILSVDISNKALIKRILNKNNFQLFNTYSKINKVEKYNTSLNSFSSPPITNNNWEKFYLYDYSSKSDRNIDFQWTWDYPNKWEYLTIWNNWTSEIEIDWKNTVIVKSWNIYIKSNLYNKNDNNSILVLVAKRDRNTGKWWNIYIDPDVTNIDAILIADWSLISMDTWTIQSVWDINQVNNIRKQLLIYGSILSSNVIWVDKIPYWADYYKKSWYTLNKDNIYDLWNLRSFNLNYWSWSLDSDKLVPIDWNWWFIENAWACKKQWYEDDNCWNTNLRSSTKRNPLIIEYNSAIKNLNPFILKNN